MAKSKTNPIQGYFFMGITNGELSVECTGDSDVLSAAFATLITSEEVDERAVKQVLADAVAIAADFLTAKNVYIPKKPVKKATKSVKKK